MKAKKWQLAAFGALFVVLLLMILRGKPGGSPAAPSARRTSDPEQEGRSRGASFGRGSETKISPEDVQDIDAGAFSRSPARVAEVAVRDLFKFKEPPPPRKKPLPPRPQYIFPSDPRFIGPRPAPPPPPPPTPPAIPFQFTGTFGSTRQPVAVLVEGDRLSLVRSGDVVDEKFIIRNVGFESIDVGFVGFPETEVRRLPLTPAS